MKLKHSYKFMEGFRSVVQAREGRLFFPSAAMGQSLRHARRRRIGAFTLSSKMPCAADRWPRRRFAPSRKWWGAGDRVSRSTMGLSSTERFVMPRK